MPRGLHPVWGSERMTDKDVLMQTQCQATLAQDTSEARLFPLRNKWLGVILPLYTTRESVWKLKPNFSKCKTKQTSFNIRFLLNKRKTFFFFFFKPWGCLDIGLGAQRCPNPPWAKASATCSSRLCLIQKVRLETTKSPISACHSSSMAFCLLICPHIQCLMVATKFLSPVWPLFMLIFKLYFFLFPVSLFYFNSYFASKMRFCSLVHAGQRAEIVQAVIANFTEVSAMQTCSFAGLI